MVYGGGYSLWLWFMVVVVVYGGGYGSLWWLWFMVVVVVMVTVMVTVMVMGMATPFPNICVEFWSPLPLYIHCVDLPARW